MGNVNIGIIGCANIVQKSIIKAFEIVRNGRIVTIASRDSKKAKEWARRFNIEHERSYEDVLKRKDIDAVYIPLPIGLHEEWVVKAAKAKKHIICEKSLSSNFNSIKKMVSICRKNKVVLYENFMCDYHPQHEKVSSLIENGFVGKVFLFRGFFGFPPLNKNNIRYRKSLGGGSLNDAGAYPVFMSRKILKSEPTRVTCSLYYDNSYNVDVQGSALLEFSQDRIAFIAFGFNNSYQNNYSVWGSEGLLNIARAFSIPADMKPNVELVKQNLTQDIEIPAADHFSLIFEDFCNKILQKQELSYSHILSQARVMEALRISSNKNMKIEIKNAVL